MESHIKIKCNRQEMAEAFENSEIFSIRYYEEIKEGLFNAVVRHKELPEYLKGTYTIKKLNKLLKSES